VTKKYADYTLVDTDNPEDLWLCGTDVAGSCQAIDGQSKYTKCLMAYVMDGKNRLLAVKNKEGKIIARHILRVLLDGDKPVLFLEKVYPDLVAPELKTALELFAKERAEKLGLPLLSKEVGKGDAYSNPISSKGSIAPFEYCDGLVDIDNGQISGITKGEYTFQGTHVVE
jgi:hypothetical protein